LLAINAVLDRGVFSAATAGDASIPRQRSSGSIIKCIARREDTTIRHPINGDNWHMSWAADDLLYVSQCDGYG
jgi:hypothetical protein